MDVDYKYWKQFVITDDPEKARPALLKMMRKGKVYYARLETGEWLYVAEEAAYADRFGTIYPGLRELQ